MRWFWIDCFEKFVSGKEATARKNVTFSEEPLDDYLPGLPHYPHTLIIEGMAQTGGLLLAEVQQFQQRVVLAKVSRAEFFRPVFPGDQLRLIASLRSLQADGAIVHGTAEVCGEKQADIEMTFAILDESYGDQPFFPPAKLLRMLRVLRLFEVGVDASGNPLRVPQHMLDEEIEEDGVPNNQLDVVTNS